MALEPSASHELSALRRLLVALQSDSTWSPPESKVVRAQIRKSYFLLDVADTQNLYTVNAEVFVSRFLPRLMRQLTRRSTTRRVTERSRLRGRVDWSGTHKARCSANSDPSLFVCQQNYHHYHTPENILLKALLKTLLMWIEQVPPNVMGGYCYPKSLDRPTPASHRLLSLQSALQRGLHHPRFQSVNLDEGMTVGALSAAENSRIEEYKVAARLYRRMMAHIRDPAWKLVSRVGGRVLLVPSGVGNDSETWVKLGAAILRGQLPL